MDAPNSTSGLVDHPCWSSRLNRLSHRQWSRGRGTEPTCERCGTPIDAEHNENGLVSWRPVERERLLLIDKLLRTIPVVTGSGSVVQGLVNPSGPEAATHLEAQAATIAELVEALGYAQEMMLIVADRMADDKEIYTDDWQKILRETVALTKARTTA